ncbi:MAG: hypothetical protein ACRCZF_17815 [Gemmataceae bacterium]
MKRLDPALQSKIKTAVEGYADDWVKVLKSEGLNVDAGAKQAMVEWLTGAKTYTALQTQHSPPTVTLPSGVTATLGQHPVGNNKTTSLADLKKKIRKTVNRVAARSATILTSNKTMLVGGVVSAAVLVATLSGLCPIWPIC